jgi:hypothetical protein
MPATAAPDVLADVTDRGLGRLNWADSRPTGVSQGPVGIDRRPGIRCYALSSSPPVADYGAFQVGVDLTWRGPSLGGATIEQPAGLTSRVAARRAAAVAFWGGSPCPLYALRFPRLAAKPRDFAYLTCQVGPRTRIRCAPQQSCRMSRCGSFHEIVRQPVSKTAPHKSIENDRIKSKQAQNKPIT